MKAISLLIVSILSAVFVFATPVVTVQAQTAKEAVCDGLGAGTTCAEPEQGNVKNVVAAVIEILSWVAGVLGVVMVIISGFKYITSGGDANKVGSAKKTLLYALIGLAIAALTQVIVRFVVTETTQPPPVNGPLVPDIQ